MRLDDVVRKYDAAAKHYDRFMDLVFGALLDIERHRARVVELLGELDGRTVLDVGCGTGRNFPLLVERVGEHGRVIGLDCSNGMLGEARRLVERRGWRNVELVLDDAVSLGRIREPVDAVLSVWCYGTVYDLDAALDRAIDVLRPNGTISIMTFGRAGPERGALRWLYPFYRFAVRSLGMDPGGDFDNAALEAKWQRGRRVLRSRLGGLHEERYLNGAGLIISGRKPLERAGVVWTAAPARSAAVLDDGPDGSFEEGAAVP